MPRDNTTAEMLRNLGRIGKGSYTIFSKICLTMYKNSQFQKIQTIKEYKLLYQNLIVSYH